MHTILGAGGAIAQELTKVLLANNQAIRLVSRNPSPVPGTTTFKADLSSAGETAAAVKEASVVYLCPGLPYDHRVWAKTWPLIMQNTIEACKDHGAKLIFFDNVYCLGKVKGPMTETSPYNPSGRKGSIRAAIANRLLEDINTGNLTALIARSADFYGPGCRTSVINMLVLDRLAKGKKPQYMISADFKHSYTYTPDCGQALWLLSQKEDAFNQTWHLPTAHPALSGAEMIALAAAEFGKAPRYTELSRGYLRFGGLFSRMVGELQEMLYQNESDYLFDSTKFENAFGMKATPYSTGIKQTVAAYKS